MKGIENKTWSKRHFEKHKAAKEHEEFTFTDPGTKRSLVNQEGSVEGDSFKDQKVMHHWV